MITQPPSQIPLVGNNGTVSQNWFLFFNSLFFSLKGKADTSGTVTLTPNKTTTTVTNAYCGTASGVYLSPSTDTASLEKWYITTARGAFTINHANAATVNRTFKYSIIG